MEPIMGVGYLDGQSMIEMNNLTVGYFPVAMPEIGVYPAPVHVPEVPVVLPMPAVEQLEILKRSPERLPVLFGSA